MLHHVKNGATVEDVSSQVDIVTMGINPSRDRLHLGHYLTMLQAGKALHANRDTTGIFFVDDREHHHKLTNGVDKGTFRLPSYQVTKHVQGLMEEFVKRIADELEDKELLNRVTVLPMSEYMSAAVQPKNRVRKQGSLLFEQLWEHRREINRLFEFTEKDGMQYVRPFCQTCKYSVNSDDHIRVLQPGILSMCLSQTCPTDQLNVWADQGQMNWSMHYAVDPIRDGLLARLNNDKRVLHVFGGDYGVPWGVKNHPKASRMSVLMESVAPEMIDHFVGPMLTKDGQKLAKSNGDAHDTPAIGYLNGLLAKNESYIEVMT